jgi:hypothetical protein
MTLLTVLPGLRTNNLKRLGATLTLEASATEEELAGEIAATRATTVASFT